MKSEKAESTIVNEHFSDEHNDEIDFFLQIQLKTYYCIKAACGGTNTTFGAQIAINYM